jgi:transglutaminase-like putative cysteine protease
MTQIVEVDERGTIQLPADLLTTLKPHARFVLERRGATLVLRPVASQLFWATATPEERAAAVRRWAGLESPCRTSAE